MLMDFGDVREDQCGDIDAMRFGESRQPGTALTSMTYSLAVAADEQIDAGDRGADDCRRRGGPARPTRREARSPRRLRRG